MDIQSEEGISVFVPTYNGTKMLEKNIPTIYKNFLKYKKKFEVIIVDDNSKDNSKKIIKKLANNFNGIKSVFSKIGPSRRENLAQAFHLAQFEKIMFMDLDLATELDNIPLLLDYIDKGYDIIIGSRYKELKSKRKIYRRIISLIYNSFMKIYLGSKIDDHQCGFKGGKKSVFVKLINEMGYDSSFNRGWFWDVEFLVRAQYLNLNIMEFPVDWHYTKESSFNIFRELRMVPSIIKLPFKIKKEYDENLNNNPNI